MSATGRNGWSKTINRRTSFLPSSAFDAAKQASLKPDVGHRVAIHVDGQRLAWRARVGADMADRQARLADHLGHEFDLAAGVVVDVAADGFATGRRLQGAIDVGGGGHDLAIMLRGLRARGTRLQGHERHLLAVEHRRGGVRGAEIDPDAQAAHGTSSNSTPSSRQHAMSASLQPSQSINTAALCSPRWGATPRTPRRRVGEPVGRLGDGARATGPVVHIRDGAAIANGG